MNTRKLQATVVVAGLDHALCIPLDLKFSNPAPDSEAIGPCNFFAAIGNESGTILECFCLLVNLSCSKLSRSRLFCEDEYKFGSNKSKVFYMIDYTYFSKDIKQDWNLYRDRNFSERRRLWVLMIELDR